MIPRLNTTTRSLLAAFALYGVPLIHAAAIASSMNPESESLISIAKRNTWFSSFTGSSGPFARATSAPVSATATDATAYLRIASLSIALYDFLMTIPAEVRLYIAQPGITKISRACLLFIMVRYTSVAALISSNVGFFGTGFSAETCSRYQLVAPILKVIAVLFSQLIVSIRTYAISRKEPWVLYLLSTLFIVCMVPEFLGNTWMRVPVQNKDKNCTSGNSSIKAAWLHYLAAMIFDAVAMGISTTYLVIHSPSLNLMSGLSRLMLKEGMVYFILLTGANILNLVLFKTSSIATQSSAASLGQAVTMIMSQHIILSLHDWRATSSGGPDTDRNPTSNHELGPVSYAGNYPGNGGVNVTVGPNGRRMGVTGGGNGGITSVQLGGNSRRLSKHAGVTSTKNFIRSKRGSSEEDLGEDMGGQLEIRVQVDEEVKLDYDAIYPGGPSVNQDSYSKESLTMSHLPASHTNTTATTATSFLNFEVESPQNKSILRSS